MKIFGAEISRKELFRRIGDISQIGQTKFYEFTDGPSKGVRAADLKTPSGISMTVVIDRAMDISDLSYNNIPIAWRSAIKETSPLYYESKGTDWLRTFFGGLLTTCGLENIGPSCIDEGEELPMHGRISNIAAEDVSSDIEWADDEIKFILKGKIRQVKVFGNKLELSRKIITFMDEPKIIIEDEVENIGFEAAPIMILYHVNIGYPLIDQGAKLLEAKALVKPRDKEARNGYDAYDKFHAPQKSFKEQVYYHDISPDKNGDGNIAIVNENFNNGEGIGIWLKYNKDNLPHLIQWKQMGEGEYVCGIEPSNSLVRGRAIERQNNGLKFIKPGQIIKYKLELKILPSNKDIEQMKIILDN